MHLYVPSPRAPRRVRLVLGVALAVVVLATAAGVVALWPHTSTAEVMPSTPPGGSFQRVEVTSVDAQASPEDHAAATGTLVGAEAGAEPVRVHVPPEQLAEVSVGDVLVVLHVPDVADQSAPYFFVDYVRDVPLALLAALYAVVVVLVARWRGVFALAGLGLSFGVLAAFTLPALLEGQPAAPVALVTGSAVMLAVLYLAHGPSSRTTTALLGTLGGLFVATALAAWATGAAHLTGLFSENAATLAYQAPQIQLRGVLLCGMVLAGLGVLNDVTITQASAVWELKAARPGAGARELFAGGMRIGRDHIASTVYTIVFAYVGAALPLILLMSLSDRSLVAMLTAGEVAEEVVRTLVGSVGLVLAIPFTTVVAALVVSAGDRRRASSGPARAGPSAPP